MGRHIYRQQKTFVEEREKIDKGRKWGDTFIDRKRHLLKKDNKGKRYKMGRQMLRQKKTFVEERN
jgi:hypothetical protein